MFIIQFYNINDKDKTLFDFSLNLCLMDISKAWYRIFLSIIII